ncbi:MAG TPA: DUF1254 domain-containing protein [Rhizomicrobium sp.]|jgi:uncharacterized membrane protein
MSSREWIGWSVATLIVAAAVHIASVWYLPHAIMHIALNRMGAANTIHHQNRPDEHARGVVRPSPDLLYSACRFDLSKDALEVKAEVPPNTYWSVSAFDADTNNFFALNDRQIGNQPLELIILPPDKGTEPMHIAGRLVIRAPTTQGLVLFRTLISNEKDFAKIDAVRRQATCGTWTTGREGASSGG